MALHPLLGPRVSEMRHPGSDLCCLVLPARRGPPVVTPETGVVRGKSAACVGDLCLVVFPPWYLHDTFVLKKSHQRRSRTVFRGERVCSGPNLPVPVTVDGPATAQDEFVPRVIGRGCPRETGPWRNAKGLRWQDERNGRETYRPEAYSVLAITASDCLDCPVVDSLMELQLTNRRLRPRQADNACRNRVFGCSGF